MSQSATQGAWLAGTGYEQPPAQVTSYTPMADIIQRIYDNLALAIKTRDQSGSQTAYITTATTTTIKSGAGVVGTITNSGTATSGTITIKDGNNTLWSGALTAGQVLTINMPVSAGISVITAAANTIALSWS